MFLWTFFLLVTLQVRHTEMVLDRGRVGSLNLNLLIKQCTCPTQAIEVKNGNGIEAGGWIAHPEDAELQIMEECGSFPRPLSLQHKASFPSMTAQVWNGLEFHAGHSADHTTESWQEKLAKCRKLSYLRCFHDFDLEISE